MSYIVLTDIREKKQEVANAALEGGSLSKQKLTKQGMLKKHCDAFSVLEVTHMPSAQTSCIFSRGTSNDFIAQAKYWVSLTYVSAHFQPRTALLFLQYLFRVIRCMMFDVSIRSVPVF